MVLVNVSVFLLVVFVFFCWCLCLWFSFIIPFFFLQFSFFFFLLSFFFFGLYVFLFLFFSPSPLASFPSLVFPFLHHLCYFCFFSFLSCFFACISFDCSCCCGSCHYSSSFSACVSSSPQPPARIWTGKQWTKKQIILFAFRGSLRKCPFTESLFLFSLVDFFHPQNMFLFHVLGLSFEVVRDSLLFHICFFCVWCLAHNLLSVQLVSCACILWIRCLLCSSSSFFVFLLVWCFCYGFWFVSCQFLSLSWDCLSLIALSWCCFFYFVSWLLVCVWVGFWAAFWRELSGGVVWICPTGRGQYIYRVFS